MEILKYHKLEENPSKIVESVQVKPKLDKTTESQLLTEGYNDDNLPSFLLPKIEAIHAGTTRNHNNYPANKLQGNSDLRSGVYSFVHPYAKPVIYNHDTNTKATGRVESAAYSDTTEAGRPGIVVIPKITDKEAIRSVLDKRLLTVSIGATTDSALCNICGCDIINEGYCGHMKGEEYDGKTCEWITGNLWFDELSWVNVPADSDAMVVDTQAILTLGESNQKDCTLAEKFGVPEKSKLVVVESNQPKIQKEENNKMDEALAKEILARLEKVEEENTQLKTKLAESEDTTKETKEVESKTEEGATVEDTTEEPETKETEDTTEVTEEPTVEKEENTDTVEDNAEPTVEDNTTEALEKRIKELEEELIVEKNTNKSILSENATLQKSLKDVYINRIVRHKEFKDEEKEQFIEKIQKRSLESLKDMLTDVEESLDNGVVENTPTRTVTKVVNPIGVDTKESTEVITELSDEDKIHSLASMFKPKNNNTY